MTPTPLSRFIEARRATSPALSPDGRQLAFVSDLTGYPEAWLHRGEGRDPFPLTEFRERVGRILWTPDGRTVVLDTDLGGDERFGIRSVRPDGRGHRALSHDPAVVHLLGEIEPEGGHLSCATNGRDRACFDLGRIDIGTGFLRTLTAGDPSDFPGPWSPDGAFVVAIRHFGSFRQELALVPAAGGARVQLTPEGIEVRHLDPAFEPGGQSILVRTDRDRDFLGLARLRIGEREIAWLHAPEDRDVEAFVLSGDGRTALLAENAGGLSRLVRYDVSGGTTSPVRHPEGVVLGLSVDREGRRAAACLTHADAPPEVWILDLAGGPAIRATRSPREGLAEDEMVRPEPVGYRSFDGREIPGWLSLPRGRTRRAPAVVKIHGGPESQARPEWDPVSQYLLSRGFAVFEPNVRGSTGYGRAFAALDDRERRFDAVRDLAEAATFLAGTGRVDPGRIALYGGSYGGFMALAGLAFFPERWAAGVSLCGIANLRTFLRNTGPYRRAWRVAEYGDPERDAEFLDSISPVNHADRIRAPILVIAGANDPRVPTDEARQIVDAVGGRGGVARYLLFPDEGHGIVKLDNRRKAWEAVVRFLEESV